MPAPRRGVFPSPLDDARADATTRPFWAAALEGRLLVARCTRCGTHRLPPLPRCSVCQHDAVEWDEVPGTGTTFAFTVVRHALRPDLADVVPYVSAVVELDGTQGAGARMLLNVVDCDPDAVAIGDRVRVRFERVSETLAVPRAVPA